MDPNTSEDVRSHYIGLWMFYVGLVAIFLGMALWLADVYNLLTVADMYTNGVTFTTYLLIVGGAFLSIMGYYFNNR